MVKPWFDPFRNLSNKLTVENQLKITFLNKLAFQTNQEIFKDDLINTH